MQHCLFRKDCIADLAAAITPYFPLSLWNNSDKQAIPSANMLCMVLLSSFCHSIVSTY